MVTMATEPSPNLQLWPGRYCSLNPGPRLYFFNFHLQHLTLTILGLAEHAQPFFFHLLKRLERLVKLPPSALCFSTALKAEPPDPGAGPGSSARRPPAVRSILTPWTCYWSSFCCPAASEPSAQPVTLRERPWKSTLVTPEPWAWSNLPHLHTVPDSLQQSKNAAHRCRSSLTILCWNLDFRFLASGAPLRACWYPWVKDLSFSEISISSVSDWDPDKPPALPWVPLPA